MSSYNLTKLEDISKLNYIINKWFSRTMYKKVGIINSGGDCPGLNTVIDAVVKALHEDYEILGFYKGFEGLLAENYITLTPEITTPYKFRGGTFLKSVNKGNFAAKFAHGQIQEIEQDVIKKTISNYNKLALEGLIVLGGDGTMAVVHQLEKYGIKCIGVPKSIDNDLQGTDYTFGFQTAVDIATEALDRLETTAFSHDRVMILEVMGRNAGWIGLHSGLAGGANIILIPEIPFHWKKIKEYILKRSSLGKHNTLIVISEGAYEAEGEVVTKENSGESSENILGGIGEKLEKYLNLEPAIEARSTTLGHIQRGGSPCSFDRILSRALGCYAADLFRKREFGKMVSYSQGEFKHLDIVECASKIKKVDPLGSHVQTARKMGISFGD